MLSDILSDKELVRNVCGILNGLQESDLNSGERKIFYILQDNGLLGTDESGVVRALKPKPVEVSNNPMCQLEAAITERDNRIERQGR